MKIHQDKLLVSLKEETRKNWTKVEELQKLIMQDTQLGKSKFMKLLAEICNSFISPENNSIHV